MTKLRHVILFIMAVILTPAAAQDKLLEMSIDEAIDMAYDEYIREVAPDMIKDYASLSIEGESAFDAEVLSAFVKKHNPDFNSEIAAGFVEIGRIYGIRGDVAFCQAIVETGWFKYSGGTKVKAEHHNYCGLGVTSKGKKGVSFPTVQEGVTAHIQHLFAYCSKRKLPGGEQMVDPRFSMVKRGCARRWHELNGRWAMNDRYSTAILSVYARLGQFARNNNK